ncbi:MAG: 16S rRNA (guanine(966)-N(2))-methyltransferase RsmD [Deltaproteobacteria bacterium]|nr:16S rRNA (guanine(966)-N(2))-methyltransferase RsmD [Deltaproteobacteria bacterium]
MLQVLTGTIKGRKLKVPKGQKIRPTTSRVKKSIFDTLSDISGVRVLDVFAGSGGLGIESLSRGAEHVTFIEKDPSVFKILNENYLRCGFLDKATPICSHYIEALSRIRNKKETFDLIFIDPPYKLYNDLEVKDFIHETSKLLDADGVIVIEHDHKIEHTPKGFKRATKSFGGTHVSYFRKGE